MEKSLLIQGFLKYGHSWVNVAKVVQTRTPKQCGDHWNTRTMQERYKESGIKPLKSYPPSSHVLTQTSNYITPSSDNKTWSYPPSSHELVQTSSNITPSSDNKTWTEEEELLLIQGYNRYAHEIVKWENISAVVQTKTPMQCKGHWSTRTMKQRLSSVASTTSAAKSIGTKVHPPSVPSNTVTKFAYHQLRPKGIYRTGIVQACEEIRGSQGYCSMVAIKKHIKANMAPDKKWINTTFLTVLNSLVESGELVVGKSGMMYKLSKEYKRDRNLAFAASASKFRGSAGVPMTREIRDVQESPGSRVLEVEGVFK